MGELQQPGPGVRFPRPKDNRDPRLVVPGPGLAGAWASHLLQGLAQLGLSPGATPAARDGVGGGSALHGDLHSDLEWAASGAMALSGEAGGPPLLAPAPVAACARGALEALSRLDPVAGERVADVDAPALLGERAACFGLGRRGPVAPGGACRMLRARDGWLALNLAREDDWGLLPAWLEIDRGAFCSEDPWVRLPELLASRSIERLMERGRLMGLALASPDSALAERPCLDAWLRVQAKGAREAGREPAERAPRVVDLSSLWAGPLCGSLLHQLGGDVVKVESLRRPDGARRAEGVFFDLLNTGKRSVALDFAAPEGRGQLLRLIEAADIVVESARPRALDQLGIRAQELVGRRPGLTWLSVTGYGRSEPEAGWVAFGDDAAVAAGLVARPGGRNAAPLFCGDAIADPLTGLHAALAAWASWCAGGGDLLDVSLCGVSRAAMAFAQGAAAEGSTQARVVAAGAGFRVELPGDGGGSAAVAPPRARVPRGRAASLGADNGELPWDALAPRC